MSILVLAVESGLDVSKHPDDKSPTILSRLVLSASEISAADLSSPPSLIKLEDLRRIYDGRDSTVYRATLVRDGYDPLDVVLKTDIYKHRADSLIREAKVYENQAKDLQGVVVPHFYGIFQGQVADTVMTCLVLDYCGENIHRFFAGVNVDADVEFNMDILEKVMWLHDAGLVHNHISETNIVSKDGAPFLIDLELAKPHKCERTMDIVEGAMQPRQHEFDCDELYFLAREMGIWIYPYITVYGETFARQSITSPEQLASMAPGYRLETPEQRQQALEEARRVVDEYGLCC